MREALFSIVITVFAVSPVFAQSWGHQGRSSNNHYSHNSTYNRHGAQSAYNHNSVTNQYGHNKSPYSHNSVTNQYGHNKSPYSHNLATNQYGHSINPYNRHSVTNPHSTNTHRLYDHRGDYRGGHRNNHYYPDSLSNLYERDGSFIAPDSDHNPYGHGLHIFGD